MSMVRELKGKDSSRIGGRVVRTPTARQIYLAAPAMDEHLREEQERAFFSALRMRNGTYKYTYPHRLDDLNELVAAHLPCARPLEIMDVAVSSGVSTLEWMESLERAGIEHTMVAGDLTMYGFLVSRGAHLHALTDSTGYPLQFEIGGRAVPNPAGRRLGMLYALPLALLRASLSTHFEKLREDCLHQSSVEYVERGGLTCRRLAIVSPRLRRPANLELIEDDICGEQNDARRFHILRAANILNRSYFDETVLAGILVKLRGRVRDGGLLVVCRTDDTGANHATLFSRQPDDTLSVVARLGGGSELEALALNLPRVA